MNVNKMLILIDSVSDLCNQVRKVEVVLVQEHPQYIDELSVCSQAGKSLRNLISMLGSRAEKKDPTSVPHTDELTAKAMDAEPEFTRKLWLGR